MRKSLRIPISILVAAIMIVTLVTLTIFPGTVIADSSDKSGMIVFTDNYTHIHYINLSFNIVNGSAHCSGNAQSLYSDTTTAVTVTLQKRPDANSQWSFVNSWSSTESGLTCARVYEEKAVTSGYDYRIRVTCKIYGSDGIVAESASVYSNVIHC